MRKLNRPIVWTLAAVTIAGAVASAQKRTTVFVTVVAPPSGALATLNAKDFVARGGEIANAVHADEPLSIELIVDVSRPLVGVNPPIEELRTGLQAFVKAIRDGEPSARIGMIEVAGAAVPRVKLGAPAAALDKAVGSVAPGPDMGGAVLVEAVQEASGMLANEPAPRRAIVSVDFATSDPVPEGAVDRMAKDVYKTGVSLWAVSARGSAQETLSRENALNAIIKNNGGLRVVIVEATGLKTQLQMVAYSLLSQYELTIAGVDPQHVRDVKLSTAGGAKVVPSLFAR
jgi:hypothetical protein